MTMRIWHQSFTVLQSLPSYEKAIAARCKDILRPDTEVVLHGQKIGTYPSEYPGDDLIYNQLYQMHGNQWVAAALKAEQDGFDAYAMCSLLNPKIHEIRTLVEFPVIGYGEICFHLASLYGRRFGIMLFMEKTAPLYAKQIRDYGLTDNCAGIGASGIAFKDVLAAYSDPGPVIERFSESVRKFVAESGADIIIPGELPMSMVLASNGINRIDDVPVMDGLAFTLKMAETAVELRRLTGISHSRAGYFNAAPPKDRLAYVMEFYGLDRLMDAP